MTQYSLNDQNAQWRPYTAIQGYSQLFVMLANGTYEPAWMYNPRKEQNVRVLMDGQGGSPVRDSTMTYSYDDTTGLITAESRASNNYYPGPQVSNAGAQPSGSRRGPTPPAQSQVAGGASGGMPICKLA
jgi:hypothetical protein